MNEQLPWITLAALGAYHGLNPGMGWLFAVALGLQEGSRSAVARAFGPIALGHAASVAAVVVLVGALQTAIDATLIRYAGGAVLLAFGLYKLLWPLSHPRWVGMRVGSRDLASWSFLMATAHGAGLMLIPVLVKLPEQVASQTDHATQMQHAAHMQHTAMAMSAIDISGPALMAVGLHTIAMFSVMGVLALVVYEKVGLAMLRRAWLNLDRVWAGALIGAGAITIAL
ncbi:MAG: hypothetical protein IT307_13110 [Chloroflexi bacterium]|nr:hypothetical protein [Chloroflexota bacterium]